MNELNHLFIQIVILKQFYNLEIEKIHFVLEFYPAFILSFSIPENNTIPDSCFKGFGINI